MTYRTMVDAARRQFHQTVTFDDAEIHMLRLDVFDLQLLKECDRSLLISDKLLALQLIAKRIEEKEERAATTPEAPPPLALPNKTPKGQDL